MLRKTLHNLLGVEISVLPKKFFSKLPPKGYKVVVDKNDVEDTLEFINTTFAQDEPVIKAMELDDYGDLRRYFRRCVIGSTAVKVVDDTTCQTVGLALCHTNCPRAAEGVRSFGECGICDYKTKRLLNFWADILSSHDLYDCFKVEGIWDISILCTSADMRGKGISKLLVYEAKQQGRKEGLAITRMDCTSHFSAKLASSMKFVTFPPRHVLTYRDNRGTPWLTKAPPHPHGHVVVAYDFLT